jgi:outer membrane protein assembly factor BamB
MMRGSLLAVAVIAVVAAPAGAALAGSAQPGAAASGPRTAFGPQTRVGPGSQLWVSRFGPGGSEPPYAENAEVVSPGGTRVFVTAASRGGRPDRGNFDTVAYAAGTGRRLWASRYNGPGKADDWSGAIAVSPAGAAVFVTGYGARAGNDGYATAAYNASTGKQLWASRYAGPVPGFSGAVAIAVSPDGREVFVTGDSQRREANDSDFATVAYNAATGTQLWASRFGGPVPGIDQAESVAVSPDGREVFVTGDAHGPGKQAFDTATIAYNAATGKQLWANLYVPRDLGYGGGGAVAASPHGNTVYMTSSAGVGWTTIAYNAITGQRLWVSHYHDGYALTMALSPDGTAK